MLTMDSFKTWLKNLYKPNTFRILIVEDDNSLEPVLRRALNHEDREIAVHWASRISEAEIFLQRNKYNLIISDILLRGTHTGVDFWETCQKVCPGVPFILMSSIPQEEILNVIRKTIDAPPYLQKPLRIESCRKFLEAYLP